MFICYLPYKSVPAELYRTEAGPVVIDPVSKQEFTGDEIANNPYSFYWLAALISKNWKLIKPSMEEKQIVLQLIAALTVYHGPRKINYAAKGDVKRCSPMVQLS